MNQNICKEMFDRGWFQMAFVQIVFHVLHNAKEHMTVSGLNKVCNGRCINIFGLLIRFNVCNLMGNFFIPKSVLIIMAEKTSFHQTIGIFIGQMNIFNRVDRSSVGEEKAVKRRSFLRMIDIIF